jgi:hypothetical protein
MQLTKLVAALKLPDKMPPRARAARSGAGTASQLIRSVRPTNSGANMAVPDADYVQSLTKQLDDAVPREGHVEVIADPREPDYWLVRANQLAYLGLGIEFLKAAYAPEVGGKDRLVSLDLGYLEGLDQHCYSFERREDVWSPISSGESAGTFSQIVGLLFGLYVAASFLVGVFTVFQWLSAHLF